MFIGKEKFCPKCGSESLYLDNDEGLWSEHCFLCGYEVLLKELKTSDEVEKHLSPVDQNEG